MAVVIVVGAQWGDEGKGKIIDLITPSIDVVVRFQGGANAGHTVVIGEQKTILHLVPSGILHGKCLCIIGNGVVVDPDVLIDEIDGLYQRGYLKNPQRLVLAQNAHLVLPYHRSIDKLREEALGEASIGTTGRGIGPAYEDKAARIGIRAGELKSFDSFKKRLLQVLPFKNREIEMLGGAPIEMDALLNQAREWCSQLGVHVVDAENLIHKEIGRESRILLEGAQGTALDIDHGTYPFVTSSNTVAGEACCGSGIGPTLIDEVVGVVKAYTTRVGNGPFPTELGGKTGEHLQTKGREFGATTGRKRRCGWFDAVLARHAKRVNGLTMLAVTKLDVLSGLDELKICTGYKLGGKTIDYFPSSVDTLNQIEPVYESYAGWKSDISGTCEFGKLPPNARKYISRISEILGIAIAIISTGYERNSHIMMKKIF